jgi:hypothetical protein
MSASNQTEVRPEPALVVRRWRWPGAKFYARLGVSAALIAYLAWQCNFDEISRAIRTLDWLYWSLALAIYLASQLLSSWRWSALARAVGFDHSLAYFCRRYFEGMFFSLCLPTSIGGDVVKAWKLGRHSTSRWLAACTVLTDRDTGLLAMLSIGALALAYRQFQPSAPVAVGAAIGFALLGFAALRGGLVVWGKLAEPLERLPKAGAALKSLRPYREKPNVLLRAIVVSVAIQSSNAVMVWAIALAMGLSIPLSAFFIAVPAAALASLLPSISGLGVREAALAWFLSQYGLSSELGVTIGLLWFLIVVVGGLAGGGIYLADRGTSAAVDDESLMETTL